MAMNGLASAILLLIVFGWLSILLMLICWYVWKGDFKSSYNYRPKWAQVNLPEDVKTKIDRVAAKWLFFIAGAFLCAMVVGFAYGFATGHYDDLPTIFLATATAWGAIMFALVICGYIYAWLIVNRKNVGKT
ncbi:MAG: hypothetical protein WBZ29_05465 [Methanocella sp.]